MDASYFGGTVRVPQAGLRYNLLWEERILAFLAAERNRIGTNDARAQAAPEAAAGDGTCTTDPTA